MRSMNQALSVTLYTAIFIVVINIDSAYAYLDPGSGSFIFQVLIAMLLGSVVTIKIYWKKFKLWISSLFSKGTPKRNDEE